jgi:hypothetical protein
VINPVPVARIEVWQRLLRKLDNPGMRINSQPSGGLTSVPSQETTAPSPATSVAMVSTGDSFQVLRGGDDGKKISHDVFGAVFARPPLAVAREKEAHAALMKRVSEIQ